MIRWLWRKPQYVPIVGSSLPLSDRMERGILADYEAMAALAHNGLHVDILLHILRQVRESADRATTPEELKGLTRAIQVIKAAMAMPYEAERHLRDLRSERAER